jgi:hypothetical protein
MQQEFNSIILLQSPHCMMQQGVKSLRCIIQQAIQSLCCIMQGGSQIYLLYNAAGGENENSRENLPAA